HTRSYGDWSSDVCSSDLVAMRFDDALRELEARQPERMVPDLSRITALAALLDQPQLTYPTIHVTGTNGKTTTSRLIGRILCAHRSEERRVGKECRTRWWT